MRGAFFRAERNRAAPDKAISAFGTHGWANLLNSNLFFNVGLFEMGRKIFIFVIGLFLASSLSAQNCLTPTQEFAAELKTFLTNGADFEKMVAVKSQSHRNAYYIAVHLEVPGTSGWALFASNTIEGFGQFYAIDDIANQFSSLIDGRETKAEFSASDPAARRARACLKSEK